MKTVLITGSEGFIGKNLRASLSRREDITLLCYDVQDSPWILKDAVGRADFVFHLAGVNRPTLVEEFHEGNARLTERICEDLAGVGRKPGMVISSSTQAALDNPYGESKKAAEEAVLAYGRQTGAPVYVYRLPNVFGKWCRPNYNSAIATFCHNIARNMEIQVRDPDVELNLVYIDDVVESFVKVMDSRGGKQGSESYSVQPVHSVKLGAVAALIRSFQLSREQRGVPDMSDPFTRKLYSTYLSYLPTDQFSYPLHMNVDARGSFTEFIRTPDRGQVSVNVSKPRITKGNHWHSSKNEKFLVVSGQGVIRFRRIGASEIVEYPVSGDRLAVVDIPPGYTHNITNSGDTDMVTIMWCNEAFDPNRPDTFFEAV